MKRAVAEAIAEARQRRRAVALLTNLGTGEQMLFSAMEPPDSTAPYGPLGSALREAAEKALTSDRAQRLESSGENYFIQPFAPAPRLILVGAVHIAQHLAAMATDLGHAVCVVDPRSAFLTEARFPGVTRRAQWPEEAFAALPIDARTAVVTLSHDPKIDDPALAAALASGAYYIGCLGSQTTQARRRTRLAEHGFSDADLARLSGPVGLDIGAQSPAEIALSIAAEITERLRRPETARPDRSA